VDVRVVSLHVPCYVCCGQGDARVRATNDTVETVLPVPSPAPDGSGGEEFLSHVRRRFRFFADRRYRAIRTRSDTRLPCSPFRVFIVSPYTTTTLYTAALVLRYKHSAPELCAYASIRTVRTEPRFPIRPCILPYTNKTKSPPV